MRECILETESLEQFWTFTGTSNRQKAPRCPSGSARQRQRRVVVVNSGASESTGASAVSIHVVRRRRRRRWFSGFGSHVPVKHFLPLLHRKSAVAGFQAVTLGAVPHIRDSSRSRTTRSATMIGIAPATLANPKSDTALGGAPGSKEPAQKTNNQHTKLDKTMPVSTLHNDHRIHSPCGRPVRRERRAAPTSVAPPVSRLAKRKQS